MAIVADEVPGEWQASIVLYGERTQLDLLGSVFEDGFWILTASVPENVDEGLYDLEVLKGETYDVEEHAVWIGKERDSLVVVHITDTHMDGTSFRSQAAQSVVHCVDVINLIRPDLVVVTGDITSMTTPTEGDARSFADLILHNLEVPVYLTPGNHDVGVDLGPNPNVGYYAFQNPYPDYAFDFGPVHFISLDQGWQQTGSYVAGSFSEEQLAFLESELSSTAKNLTCVMFHDPWAAFQFFGGFNYTLALAGHTHWNAAYMTPGGSLLLVTGGASDIGNEMIRVISFSDDEITSCSLRPKDLASAVPTRLVEIDVSPAKGGSNYQELVVTNRLAAPLLNASWTFNLSRTEPGWGPLVLGGSLESTVKTSTETYYRVRFDIGELSRRRVECLNMVPTNQKTANTLGKMVDDSLGKIEPLRVGLEPYTACMSGPLDHCQEYLRNAAVALDAGNWTEAAIQFSRASHILVPIQELAQAFQNADSELMRRKEGGLNTSLVRLWREEAIRLLEEQGLYPSLLDTRKGSPTPIGLLQEVSRLGEEVWILADEIARVNHIVDEAVAEGQDLPGAQSTIAQAYAWFGAGYYSLARQSLDTIVEQYPSLFVHEAHLAAIALLIASLLPRSLLHGRAGN